MPGFEHMTNNQMFFLAWGQVWRHKRMCRNHPNQTFITMMSHDSHGVSYHQRLAWLLSSMLGLQQRNLQGSVSLALCEGNPPVTSNYKVPVTRKTFLWASYQIRKIGGALAPGTFSPSPQVSDPDMHHGTCVTHVPWYMPGSLTSVFLWNRWRGKTFPAFPGHAQPAILRIWLEAHERQNDCTMYVT